MTPKTTDKRMRNNSGVLEECSKKEINRGRNGEKWRKRRNTEKEHARESFHRELRTETLLCREPQGADDAPGREEERGMTKSVKTQRPGGH